MKRTLVALIVFAVASLMVPAAFAQDDPNLTPDFETHSCGVTHNVPLSWWTTPQNQLWGWNPDVGDDYCPQAIGVDLTGTKLVVGWYAGGCIEFEDLKVLEGNHRVVVTVFLRDRSQHFLVKQEARIVYGTCTGELVLGAESIELEPPLGGRSVHARSVLSRSGLFFGN